MKICAFSTIEEDKNCRIDQFLTVKLKTFTRSQVQKLCDNNQVIVNGKPVAKNYRLSSNEIIQVKLIEEKTEKILPENIPLNIIYEDEYLAVIDKPKGMVVHPAVNITSGTLVNALLYKYGGRLSDIGGEFRPGIVHRLDKDTSGLLVVAFDNNTHEKLSAMLKVKEIQRRYKAVVYGSPKDDEGEIEQPIGRDPVVRVRMAVTGNGRYAKTYYKVLERFLHFSLLEMELSTGRTHQIRVHLANMGNPIAGDSVYGPKKVITELNGQCLHAYNLEFNHPITGEHMTFFSELPDYFVKFLTKISAE